MYKYGLELTLFAQFLVSAFTLIALLDIVLPEPGPPVVPVN